MIALTRILSMEIWSSGVKSKPGPMGQDLYFKEKIVMPIYEYRCSKCNLEFEYLVFGNDKPDCPACKSKKVDKLMSACGFVSKGSGGETVSSSASASGCSGCSASSCAGCG